MHEMHEGHVRKLWEDGWELPVIELARAQRASALGFLLEARAA